MAVALERPAPTRRIDPITLEVVRHSLVAIMDEAEANLTRTAFSQIIREVKDYCVGMVSATGETIAQSRGSIPTFVADLGSPVLDGLAIYGDDLHDGDIIITNYAGVCGQHLNNVVMYTPVFAEGQIAVFSALRTHWPDVGGVGLTTTSTEIFQEGVQFRCVKIYKRGVLDRDIERIIRYNTRTPDATFGDLEAQIAACELVKRRFQDLLARHGWPEIEAAIHECWDQSERYVRQQIRSIPNGRYFASSFLDNDGITDEPVPIPVTVIVENEDIVIDFTDMPPQVAGPYNSGATGGGMSAARVAFKGAVAPFLLPNEGEFRPLTVRMKPGTIVSASADAPMAFWSIPIKTVIDVTLSALSQAIPDRIAAGSNAQYASAGARGRDPRSGQAWSASVGALGGWGGHASGDGQSAMMTTTHGDTRRAPVEVIETESPGIITLLELVPDSAGAGKFRGGLGTRMEVLVPFPGNANVAHDRSKFPPWGLFGGREAMASYAEIFKPGEPALRVAKIPRVPVPAGTRIRSTNNGGGGWGDPLDRDVAAIAWDIRQGYITPAAAERDYGAVFDATGQLDQAATEQAMRARRTSRTEKAES
jgi:N-methylhydantoinase B